LIIARRGSWRSSGILTSRRAPNWALAERQALRHKPARTWSARRPGSEGEVGDLGEGGRGRRGSGGTGQLRNADLGTTENEARTREGSTRPISDASGRLDSAEAPGKGRDPRRPAAARPALGTKVGWFGTGRAKPGSEGREPPPQAGGRGTSDPPGWPQAVTRADWTRRDSRNAKAP